MRRILWLVALVIVGVIIYYGYNQYKTKKNLDDGAVSGSGMMSPEEKRRFDAEDHGGGTDGGSERKSAAPSASDAAANPEGMPNGGNSLTNQPTDGSSVTGAPLASGPAPVSDTVKPNPTNGEVFAGTGTYQWYRQGNLTWRVNTTTGSSCIVYATMEEWRKSIVLNHGCGNG